MVKVYVIIPCYNVAKYLGQCLDSVLKQTFQDFEVLCVNDGSTDKSLEILQQYAEKDERVKIIDQENKGLSEARNIALDMAQGEFIAFADSDDYYATNFLELLFNAQKNTKADIVGCDFQKIYKSTDVLRPISQVHPRIYKDALKVLLHKDNFIHFNVWNKLYKRDVIGNMRFVPHIYYEDWVFNCCVFERANGFAWIKEKLYAYRISNSSIMRSNFNEKKLQDYATGIHEVHDYFITNAPDKWKKVRQTCISRTVKMMMNSVLRSKNDEIKRQVACVLQNLYNKRIVGYKGLSWLNKVKLYKFLYMKV